MAQPIKAGIVGKNVAQQPDAPKVWNKRFIAIEHSGVIRIHESPDQRPLLVLPIKDCGQRGANGDEFFLQYPGKIHEFKTANAAEAQAWIAAFNSATPGAAPAGRGAGPNPGAGRAANTPPGRPAAANPLATNPNPGARGGPGLGASQPGGFKTRSPSAAPPMQPQPPRPQHQPAEPDFVDEPQFHSAEAAAFSAQFAPTKAPEPEPVDQFSLSSLDDTLDGIGDLDNLQFDDLSDLSAPPTAATPEIHVPEPEPEPVFHHTPEPVHHVPEPVVLPPPPAAAQAPASFNTDHLDREIESLKHQLSAATTERETLSKKYTTQIKELETNLASAGAKLKETQAEVDIAKMDYQEKIEQLTLASSGGKSDALQDELGQLKQSFRELQSKLQISEKEAKERATQVASLTVEMSDKNRQISEHKSQIEKIEQELKSKDTRLASLSEQAAAMGQSSGAFTQELQNQVQTLTTKLTETNSAALSSQKTIANLKTSIQQLEGQLLDLDTENQDLKKDAETKQATIHDLKTSSQSSAQEITTITEELREARLKVMDLTTALQKAPKEAPAASSPPKKSFFGGGDKEVPQIADVSSSLEQSVFLQKIKEKDVLLAQVTSKLKTREVELQALKSDSHNQAARIESLSAELEETSHKLEAISKRADQADEKMAELDTIVNEAKRAKVELESKDTQIASLREALLPADDASRNTRIQKKNEVIEQLNEIITNKDKQIADLDAKVAGLSKDSLQPKIKSLEERVSRLTSQAEKRKATIKGNEKTIADLKDKFSSAYEDGRLVANISDIDLRFRADDAEHSKKVAEANLAKQEQINKELRERCERIEKALVGAKKVEYVETKFAEMLRLIEGQKKQNRGAYKAMCERVKTETEEKKVLQAKLLLLKTEYKKVTTQEGPTPAELKEEIENLKHELETKTAKLVSIATEFKALAQKHALLEAEFERS